MGSYISCYFFLKLGYISHYCNWDASKPYYNINLKIFVVLTVATVASLYGFNQLASSLNLKGGGGKPVVQVWIRTESQIEMVE